MSVPHSETLQQNTNMVRYRPMYVVSGIPISRGIGVDELSYYTVRDVQPGSLVTAPIRGTLRPLLVTKVAPVTNMKASLRAQSFELQKLGPDAPVTILFPEILEALELAQQETLVHKGALLYTCVPDFVLHESAPLTVSHATVTTFEHIPVQASYADRMSVYKNTVRESFARNESVFVVVPTRADVLRVSEGLAQGVAQYTIPLHGSLSTKVARSRWSDAVTREHPVVVVATPSFLALPRHDLGTIICERESDTAYTRIDQPYVSMRVIAECIARALRVRFIVGDTLLTARTHALVHAHTIDTPFPLTVKAKGAAVTLVRYKKSENPLKSPQEKAMQMLDQSVYARIRDTVAGGGTVVLLAPRRGVATTVFCRDCGTRTVCTVCGSGYRLHSKRPAHARSASKDAEPGPGERILACTRCGHHESAAVTCTSCGSWKLASLGMAAEGLLAELQTVLPDMSTCLVDSSQKKSVQKQLAQITIGPASLLQTHTPTLTIFPSLESLLSVPSLDADLTAARRIADAREMSQYVLIQTRIKHIDQRIQNMLDGALGEVVRNDLSLRESLHLPPYTREVHIRCEGTRLRVMADVRTMLDTLRTYKPKADPELVRESPTTVSHTTTLSFVTTKFPSELLASIQSLPTSCRVRVE